VEVDVEVQAAKPLYEVDRAALPTLGTSILLLARLRSDDRALYFLGPASYVKHESELPMAITCRLAHPLPGDLFTAFAAAVA
jgi:hypothetical protein